MFSYCGHQSSCGYCSGVLDGFWSCPRFLSSREGACRIVTGLWALVQLHTLLCGYKYFFVDSAVCYVKKQKSRRMLGVKRFCYFDIQLTLTQIMNCSSINIFLITIFERIITRNILSQSTRLSFPFKVSAGVGGERRYEQSLTEKNHSFLFFEYAGVLHTVTY